MITLRGPKSSTCRNVIASRLIFGLPFTPDRPRNHVFLRHATPWTMTLTVQKHAISDAEIAAHKVVELASLMGLSASFSCRVIAPGTTDGMYGPGVCGVVIVQISIHGCDDSPPESILEPALALHPNSDGSGCIPGHTILAFRGDEWKGAFLIPINP